jgi:hypothetical protein
VPQRHAEVTVFDEGDHQDTLLCGDVIIHLRYGEIEYVALDFGYLMKDLISVKIDGKEVILNQPEKEEHAERV